MDFRLKTREQNHTAEWLISTEKDYRDPFNEVEVSAVFCDPDGEEKIIPAFWAGGESWRVRYSSHRVGSHTFTTTCSDRSNADLCGREGRLDVVRYRGKNPLFKHGHLRVSQDRRHLEHVDETPFFWLGDTWWMGLTRRLRWPNDFKLLTRDRVGKGFTLIQIVAGLYPDMDPFDPRGANEAGFPWERDYRWINPKYFDMADRRIDWLVNNGLVPCIVGAWGYFIDFAGGSTLKKHWRNLVARYGSSPVVWCVAGEANMLFYSSPARGNQQKAEEYLASARIGWTQVTRYLRSMDPYRNPITLHPTAGGAAGRDTVEDPTIVDIDMLQPGHDDVLTLPIAVDQVVGSLAKSPKMPVVIGEVCYEGGMNENWENVQRLMFWTSILSGAAGHTYGAAGIWQVNTRSKPYGMSPGTVGLAWNNTPWEDSYRFPGSRQMGIGKKLLDRYPWWRFKPHPEWVRPHWNKEAYFGPYAAGIPGETRVMFFPALAWPWLRFQPVVTGIEHEVSYHAFFYDPIGAEEYELGTVTPDEKGEWQPGKPPVHQDWVLVMEKKD